jgi:hypothetical protein
MEFVPNQMNVDSSFTSFQDGPELGLPLVCKPITGTESVFLDFHGRSGGKVRSWVDLIWERHSRISALPLDH